MIVYLITNLVNGMRYVGQTDQTLSRRWKQHRNKKNCRYLHNAVEKYGRDNFCIEPICEVPTRELANEFETEYISRYRTLAPNGYNLFLGGYVRPPLSPEARQNLSAKISKILTGKRHSEETKRRIGEASRGRNHSEETRKKMSDAQKRRRKLECLIAKKRA